MLFPRSCAHFFVLGDHAADVKQTTRRTVRLISNFAPPARGVSDERAGVVWGQRRGGGGNFNIEKLTFETKIALEVQFLFFLSFSLVGGGRISREGAV